MRTGILLCLLAFMLAISGCSSQKKVNSKDLDGIAESYVRLVLALGQHDAGYVDAYYGPKKWQTDIQQQTLDDILSSATALIEQLNQVEVSSEELVVLRHRYLLRQLGALSAYVKMLKGERWSFDKESQALYDAVAPAHTREHFQKIVDQIDELLVKDGAEGDSFIERIENFRKEFIIPPKKLDAVFKRAIEACRERTQKYIDLPEGESFVVEYVTDKPWSGYNWYQGNYHSLIQVNTDLPIFISRAIDLACHEGYPGHHLYNTLLEKHLVRDKSWVEYSVYPLYSPQSLIAEGSANFGIQMAFPGDSRWQFERDYLFPIAGLNPKRAELYYKIEEAMSGLSYAGNEAARRYLDGDINADAAARWLTSYSAMAPARARQRVKFIDTYRSYVINYNLGKDLVRQHIEKEAGSVDDQRWKVFAELLSSPRLPSDLK